MFWEGALVLFGGILFLVFEDPVAEGGGSTSVVAGKGDKVTGLDFGRISPVLWEAALFLIGGVLLLVFEDPVFKGRGTLVVRLGEVDVVGGLNGRRRTPVRRIRVFRSGLLWRGDFEGIREAAYFDPGGGAVSPGWFGLVGFGGGEDELVKFEPILAHREVDFVNSGGGDIEPDLAEDADVDFFGALFGVPGPLLFLGPLHAGSGFGPGAVEPEVNAVVLGVGGEGTNPAVVAARGIEVDGVGEDGHFPRGVGEVLVLDEFVIMRATGVGKDLEVGVAGGSCGVGGVAIGFDVGGIFGGDDVPGPDVGLFLRNEMLRFHGNDAVLFLEDEAGIHGLGGGKRKTRQGKDE